MPLFSHDRRNSIRRAHLFPDPARNELVMVIGEFCGTFLWLLLSFISAQTAINTNDPADPSAPLLAFSLLYIAASFAVGLSINVWIFYRLTGGLFNPAITLGLFLIGALGPIRAILVFIAQLVGGIAAAAVADGLVPGPLTVTNQLKNNTNVPQGLFLEMFLTTQLILAVYLLAVEKHRATFLAPIGIGLALFFAHVAGLNYTGTSVNPARSFGPAVVAGFVGHHWIFWIGPFLGSLLAFALYRSLRLLEYQTANPGQDAKTVAEPPIGPVAGSHRPSIPETNGGSSV